MVPKKGVEMPWLRKAIQNQAVRFMREVTATMTKMMIEADFAQGSHTSELDMLASYRTSIQEQREHHEISQRAD